MTAIDGAEVRWLWASLSFITCAEESAIVGAGVVWLLRDGVAVGWLLWDGAGWLFEVSASFNELTVGSVQKL